MFAKKVTFPIARTPPKGHHVFKWMELEMVKKKQHISYLKMELQIASFEWMEMVKQTFFI